MNVIHPLIMQYPTYKNALCVYKLHPSRLDTRRNDWFVFSHSKIYIPICCSGSLSLSNPRLHILFYLSIFSNALFWHSRCSLVSATLKCPRCLSTQWRYHPLFTRFLSQPLSLPELPYGNKLKKSKIWISFVNGLILWNFRKNCIDKICSFKPYLTGGINPLNAITP